MAQPALEHVRLAGEKALLRPIRRADATVAYPELAGNQAILRWLVWGGPAGVGDLEDRFASWRTGAPERGGLLGAKGGFDYQLAIVDRADDALAGALTLRFGGHPGSGDLGYWIATGKQGRGLATEAVRLATHLAFGHLEARTLFGWVFVGNEASRRVLERNGFRLEHTARGKRRPGHGRVDEWYLAQTRWDWEAGDAGFVPLEAEVRLEP